MKMSRKWFFVFIILSCLCVCAFPYVREEPTEYDLVERREGMRLYAGITSEQLKTREELLKAVGVIQWETEFYYAWPEDIGELFYHKGFVVVALTEFTQEKIDEYRGMVSEPDCLRFVKARFSHEEINQTVNDIRAFKPLYSEYGITEDLIVWTTDVDPHVECLVPAASYESAKQYFNARYGDIVEVIVKDDDYFIYYDDIIVREEG